MPKTEQLSLIFERQQSGPVQIPDGIQSNLAPIPGIRSVVFDVYGTLFSSGVGDISLATEENRDAALRKTLKDHGIEILPGNDEVRFDDLLHDLIHQHQDSRRKLGIEYPEVDIRRVWDDFLKHLEQRRLVSVTRQPTVEMLAIDYETRVNPTQPMPELEATLTRLKAFGLLSIISNAQFYTPLLFEAFLELILQPLDSSIPAMSGLMPSLRGSPPKSFIRLPQIDLSKN